MRVLGIAGSPRRGGNTDLLLAEVMKGAASQGAEVKTIVLNDLDIAPCQHCDACLKKGNCRIDDDMQILYPKLRQADAVVIASPIYWFTVSAQTKLFMDRWYALGGPQEEYAAFSGKRIGIVLSYADLDPFVSGAVNALRTFQDAFNYVGAEIVGMIYGSASEAGEIQNNQDLMDKAYELGRQLGSGT